MWSRWGRGSWPGHWWWPPAPAPHWPGWRRAGCPGRLAVSTNDGLGASGENIARLMQRKHYYFVPYGQDDAAQKPQSLKADLTLLPAALEAALRGQQLQPVLREWN